MLTSRLPRELVTALDQEAARLRDTTGLPCSRTAALVVTLRRALAGPAVPAVVAVTPAIPVPTRDVERPDPAIQNLDGKPRPAKPVTPKAKAQPMGAGHTPAVANRDPAKGPTGIDEDTLRKRCRVACGDDRAAKEGLAKTMGYQSVAALGNWLRGSKTASETKLGKVERWLAKH